MLPPRLSTPPARPGERARFSDPRRPVPVGQHLPRTGRSTSDFARHRRVRPRVRHVLQQAMRQENPVGEQQVAGQTSSWPVGGCSRVASATAPRPGAPQVPAAYPDPRHNLRTAPRASYQVTGLRPVLPRCAGGRPARPVHRRRHIPAHEQAPPPAAHQPRLPRHHRLQPSPLTPPVDHRALRCMPASGAPRSRPGPGPGRERPVHTSRNGLEDSAHRRPSYTRNRASSVASLSHAPWPRRRPGRPAPAGHLGGRRRFADPVTAVPAGTSVLTWPPPGLQRCKRA